MAATAPSGKPPVFSASSCIDCMARDLTQIRREDGLTYADIGAVLGKSEDQAAKYCDGTALMDAVTFARGKREWNGRFTGSLDRLCEQSRPGKVNDRKATNAVLKAALELSVALEDDEEIDLEEVRKRRPAIEAAIDALQAQLRKLVREVA